MLNLLDQLTLTPLTSSDQSHFRGPASEETHIRSFGGQVVAQSLLAAGLTVASDRPCHSLHGYFLRPGNTDRPSTFAVDSVRDGRSFSMRRVDTSQDDRIIFTLMASFHNPEQGHEHGLAMPSVAAPSSLPTFDERFAGREGIDDMGRWFDRISSFDVRYAGPSPFDPLPVEGRSQVWFRFTEPLPQDQLLHRAVLAYISDLSILDPILLTHRRKWTDAAVLGASLDHAVWFHHDVDVREWMLFDQESAAAAHGRGLARAHVWTSGGKLIATVAQEALLRAPFGAVQRLGD